MKKINGILILSLAIVLGLVVACEQESLREASSPTVNEVESRNPVVVSNNVLLDDDIMSFTDEFAFEDFMHYLDSMGIDGFLSLVNSYGFNSYCNPVTGICVNTTIGNEIDEPELMAILNEYSMIHIGNHIMKLNFEEEEVYVIPDDATTIEVNQLQIAEDNLDVPSNAQIIPFEENVFDIINGTGSNDPQNAFLGCDAASKADTTAMSEDPCDLSDWNGLDCGDGVGEVTAKYFKGGIIFRLKGIYDFDTDDCKDLCFQTDYTVNINGSWNQCGSGGVGSKLVTLTGTGCRAKEVIYNKSKRLKTFSLVVDANYTCLGKNYYTGIASIGD